MAAQETDHSSTGMRDRLATGRVEPAHPTRSRLQHGVGCGSRCDPARAVPRTVASASNEISQETGLRHATSGDGKAFVAATVCCRDRRGRFLLTQLKGIDAVFARLQASSGQSAEAEQVSLEELIQREQAEQDAFEESMVA